MNAAAGDGRVDAELLIAGRIVEAWNTPPWQCSLDANQQWIMARLAARVAMGGDPAQAGTPPPAASGVPHVECKDDPTNCACSGRCPFAASSQERES